jgi:hypothetical protein
MFFAPPAPTRIEVHHASSCQSESKPTLKRLCHLVFWAEQVFQESDCALVEWRTLALDEVMRPFSPWVQQLYILRAKGMASEEHPEGLEAAEHLMPLYYLLQQPHVLELVLSAVEMVVQAVALHTLDTRLAERCRVGFRTILEVISTVDRLKPEAKSRTMMLMSSHHRCKLVLAPAAERRERLSRIVQATRQVVENADVMQAICQPMATSSKNPLLALGTAVVKSCLKDQGTEEEDCEFWSASEGDVDEDIVRSTISANALSRRPPMSDAAGGTCPFMQASEQSASSPHMRNPHQSAAADIRSGPTDPGKIAAGIDACTKRDALWKRLQSAPTSSCKYADPKAMLHAVQSRDYNSLLEFQGDVYPDGVDKIICSGGGVVAPVRMEWRKQTSEHFTGMFRRADFGLVRFSSVTEPHTPSSWSPYPALLPMVALKLFRNGSATSGNVVLARQKAGQKEGNFLAHAISNHFTQNVAFPFKAVLQLFKKYSEFPTFAGLSEFASVTQDGETESKVRAPYALVLFPPEEQRRRKVAPGKPLIEQMSLMKADDLLYEVYAVPEPVDSKRLKKPQKGVWTGTCIEECPTTKAIWRIGDVRLTAPFSTSDFGDRKLFFQHHLFEGELSLRPDWRSKVDTMIGAPEYQTLIENGDLWDPPI